MLDRPVEILALDRSRVAADEAVDAARRAALVDDDRLQAVYEVDEQDGTPFVVGAPVGGVSLGEYASAGRIDPEQARAIIGEASAALESARRHGVRHLALGPDSIHVTDDGSVVVTGAGVANAVGESIDLSPAKASRHDAAELVRLLYLALTGQAPNRSSSVPPPPPSALAPRIPHDLDDLCLRTLAEESGPASPGDLLRALAPWGDVDRPSVAGRSTSDPTTAPAPAAPVASRPAPPPPPPAPTAGETEEFGAVDAPEVPVAAAPTSSLGSRLKRGKTPPTIQPGDRDTAPSGTGAGAAVAGAGVAAAGAVAAGASAGTAGAGAAGAGPAGAGVAGTFSTTAGTPADASRPAGDGPTGAEVPSAESDASGDRQADGEPSDAPHETEQREPHPQATEPGHADPAVADPAVAGVADTNPAAVYAAGNRAAAGLAPFPPADPHAQPELPEQRSPESQQHPQAPQDSQDPRAQQNAQSWPHPQVQQDPSTQQQPQGWHDSPYPGQQPGADPDSAAPGAPGADGPQQEPEPDPLEGIVPNRSGAIASALGRRIVGGTPRPVRRARVGVPHLPVPDPYAEEDAAAAARRERQDLSAIDPDLAGTRHAPAHATPAAGTPTLAAAGVAAGTPAVGSAGATSADPTATTPTADGREGQTLAPDAPASATSPISAPPTPPGLPAHARPTTERSRPTEATRPVRQQSAPARAAYEAPEQRGSLFDERVVGRAPSGRTIDPMPWIVGLFVVVLVLAGWWAIRTVASPTSAVDLSSETPPPVPQEEVATSDPTGGELAALPAPTLNSIELVDPEGGNTDNADTAAQAADGDSSTYWRSLSYRDPGFGIKSGTGLIVWMDAISRVSGISIESYNGTSGGHVEIRIADPATPGEGTLLAEGEFTDGVTEFTFDQPVATAHLIVWITELPTSGSDGANRAEIAEITVS
ncbi:MAG: hypothetical protein ACTH0C_00640 [Actinomycetaceae bacterium]